MKEKKVKENADNELKISVIKIISSKHFKELLATAKKELEILIEQFGIDGDVEVSDSYMTDLRAVQDIEDKLSQYKIFDHVNYDSLVEEIGFETEFITFLIFLINERLNLKIESKEKEILEIKSIISNFKEINDVIIR